MYVACSTLCFSSHPLDEALRTIRGLNFQKADVFLKEDGPHLKPSDLTGDLTKICQKLKATNVGIAAFHVTFNQPTGEDVRKQLRGVCRLARAMTVPLISIDAAKKGSDLEPEIVRLKDWVSISSAEGVILTVETHAETITSDPQTALDLCRKVPGLGLTLDPSHYVSGQAESVNYDSLYPYVKHVRLRDSGKQPTEFQVRVGQGELEYGRIVTQLDRYRYDRALTVDVREAASTDFPVEPEVRKLKYLLESLV